MCFLNTFPGRDVSCLIYLVATRFFASRSLAEIQRFRRIIYIQRDDPSFSALQVRGIICCSATCVVGLFHHKTCEQHFTCFQAGRHYSHFHQHSCSGNVPSGSLISGLILLRAPLPRRRSARLSEARPAHFSTIIGDCRMTLIKVTDV